MRLNILMGFLLLAVPAAQADNGHFDKARWEKHIQNIYSQLQLTDDQRKQLQANKEQHRGKMETLRRELKKDREMFRGELMKPQLDMPKINAVHLQIKLLQAQIEDNKLNSILTVRSILTQEQFLKFVSLMHQGRQQK